MLNNYQGLLSLLHDIKTSDRKIEYSSLFCYRWTYRIQPTALHKPFKACDSERFKNWLTCYERDDANLHITPQQYRWKEVQYPAEGTKKNFIEGFIAMAGAGGPALKDGLSILFYACNANMEKEAFYSSDGDMLIVPQEGALLVKTEFGRMRIEPLEICVVHVVSNFLLILLMESHEAT